MNIEYIFRFSILANIFNYCPLHNNFPSRWRGTYAGSHAGGVPRWWHHAGGVPRWRPTLAGLVPRWRVTFAEAPRWRYGYDIVVAGRCQRIAEKHAKADAIVHNSKLQRQGTRPHSSTRQGIARVEVAELGKTVQDSLRHQLQSFFSR